MSARRRCDSWNAVSSHIVEISGPGDADEHEIWRIGFRRPTIRHMIEWDEISTLETGSDALLASERSFKSLTMWVRKNGEEVEVEDVPFEIIVDAMSLHPSFRIKSDGDADGTA